MENNLKIKLWCQVCSMLAGVILVVLGSVGVTHYVGFFVLMIFGGLLFGGGFGSFLSFLVCEPKNGESK